MDTWSRLIDWSIDRLIDWLIGCDWLTDWLTDWLIDWWLQCILECWHLARNFFNFTAPRIPALYGVPLEKDREVNQSTNQMPPIPVIVFSHGLGGMRTTYSGICCDLASHGYIVASVEHRFASLLQPDSSVHDLTSDGYIVASSGDQLAKHLFCIQARNTSNVYF